MQLRSLGQIVVLTIFVLFLTATMSSMEQIHRMDSFALLTGTLRTYQRAGCDNEVVTLTCPQGTSISVQFAHYGKQALAKDLCSNTSMSTSAKVAYNDTCLWPTSLQKVMDICQKKRECKFQTSPKTFGGDPCPGVRKYVEIAYRCRPDEFRSKMACENEMVSLKCNRTYRIAIYSATYGRTEYDSARCPQNQGVPGKNCLVSHATDTVMQICHGKRECIISADSASFGSRCDAASRMYLRVVFTCVPLQVLRDQYGSPLEEDEISVSQSSNKDHDEYYTDEQYINPSFATPSFRHIINKPGNDIPTRSSFDINTPPWMRVTDSQADSNLEIERPHFYTTSRSQPYTIQPTHSKDVEDTIKEMQRDDMTANKKKAQNITCTGQCADENAKVIGYIGEWMNVSMFVSQHQDRLYLCLILSVGVGLILCLVFVVNKVLVQRRKKKQVTDHNKFHTPSIIGFSDNTSELDVDLDLAVPDSVSSIAVRPPSHLPSIPELGTYEVICLDTNTLKRGLDCEITPPLSLNCNEYIMALSHYMAQATKVRWDKKNKEEHRTFCSVYRFGHVTLHRTKVRCKHNKI